MTRTGEAHSTVANKRGENVPDPNDRERLAQLEDRIEKLKAKDAPKPHMEEHYSQAHLAWRMVIELVVGLLIGFGIGYGLDSFFGTLPLLLIIFTLLGLAAGIKTMMRSAAELTGEPEKPSLEDENVRAEHGDRG